MKLQFKYQKFQADAAKAVADVFDGQPYLAPSAENTKGESDSGFFKAGRAGKRISSDG